MDGIVFVLCNVPLMGSQGYTAPLDSGILYRNIIQLFQVVNHVRHINRGNAKRSAAAVQIGIVQFSIAYPKRVIRGFQRGIILHIGMHACAPDVISVFSAGFDLFLHLIFFVIGHAVEVFGKFTLGMIVY